MLQIKNLHFQYDTQTIIQNISLEVQQGEIISIMGESGCGKSTLLKLIYGLYDWPKGDIFFRGKRLLGPKGNLVPGEKNMKWVSQDFDIMPHHTVAENAGKYLSNLNFEKKEKEVNKLLSVVEMKKFRTQKAKQLSGGQQQRMAIARALSHQPKLLLLDEPFGQIDNSKRYKLRKKIFTYVRNKNITTLLVTHDIEDALSFSDKIIILKDGKIVQNNTPKEIYQNPKNKYVAELFGDVNVLKTNFFNSIESKKLIYYHQIEECNEGKLVTVKNCFYRGKEFVTEVEADNQILFFTAVKEYKPNQKITLNIKP